MNYQIAENAILCLSSVVFASWTGLITLSLAIFRNVLLMKDFYSKKWMVIISAAVAGSGIIVNTKGVIGLLPVIAALEWTISNYYFRDILHVKISLLINIVLWCIYFFAIWDFSSGIAQLITGVICLQSIYYVSRKVLNE